MAGVGGCGLQRVRGAASRMNLWLVDGCNAHVVGGSFASADQRSPES